MALLSKPSFGPRTAITYVTLGTLMGVWTAVWYFAFVRGGDEPMSNSTWFWLVGIFCTGLTLITIGLLLGPLGRAARKAELPPADATRAEASIQHTAAAVPNPVVPGTVPANGAVPMNGAVPAPPAMPAAPAQPVYPAR